MNKLEEINKKRGNELGFWFFRAALKLFGLAGACGLLYFVYASTTCCLTGVEI